MADKVIYMRPGETLEIRHVTHDDFDKNAKSWWDQTSPQKDLIKVNGPHSITPATSMFECHHWKTWSAPPPAPNAVTAGQGVEVERLLGLIRWAHDTLYEINPSNYDHDEVCKVNDASVEVILSLAVELGEKHGKPDEWWAARSALAIPTPKEESK